MGIHRNRHELKSPVLALFLLLLLGAIQAADAADPKGLTIQIKKQGFAPPPAGVAGKTPKLEGRVERKLPASAIYQEEPVTGPGIVGLDMLIQRDRYPVIQAVFQGTPAYARDMRPGDAIIAVNGIQTLGKSRETIDAMISDVPGEVVNFTVAREHLMLDIPVTVMALPGGR